MSIEVNFVDEEFSLMSEKNRLKTFKDWGFDGNAKSTCSSQKVGLIFFVSFFCVIIFFNLNFQLAEAGFSHVSGDNVKCVVCFKELEGWEPDDDPW